MCPTSRPSAALSRAALLGVLTLLPAAAIAGDAKAEGAPKGRLFVSAGTGPHHEMSGIGVIDVGEGTWFRLMEEYSPAARVSPDGRSLAYLKLGPAGSSLKGAALRLVDWQGATPPVRLFDGPGRPCWSPDGKRLIISTHADPARLLERKFETWRLDADGSNRVKLPIPETDCVTDWSTDGQWLLATSSPRPPDENRRLLLGFGWRPIYLVRPDGTGERLLVPADMKDVANERRPVSFIRAGRFSPDGRRVAYSRRIARRELAVWVVDVDGSSSRPLLKLDPDKQSAVGVCWSPDGQWLAASVSEVGPERGAFADYHVELIGADGSGRRKIELPAFSSLFLLDWRDPEK